LEQDIAVLCGAMTPTEITVARTTGTAVKLFPAAALGAGYVRSLKGPYPDIELLVVGGISVHNLAAYLSAGALGAGIGGTLTDVDWSKPDWEKTTRIAAELMEIAREFTM
jgi:2-dehydro-3-deoxyphosphogluconate aldolase/(4S)-4-hydroxy-2-oxoglutarate aldolase